MTNHIGETVAAGVTTTKSVGRRNRPIEPTGDGTADAMSPAAVTPVSGPSVRVGRDPSVASIAVKGITERASTSKVRPVRSFGMRTQVSPGSSTRASSVPAPLSMARWSCVAGGHRVRRPVKVVRADTVLRDRRDRSGGPDRSLAMRGSLPAHH
jgi:hypothetical protein